MNKNPRTKPKDTIHTVDGGQKPTPKRVYSGALISRLTSDWVTSSTSADAEIYSSHQSLRNRSRDLLRNNDYLKGAVNKIVDNVIGGDGVGFQAQVKKSSKLDTKINTLIEEVWAGWCEEGCDVREQLSFPDLEALVFRSLIESGEVIIRLVRQPFGGSKIPLSLELIEADQLADDYTTQTKEGNQIRMGVEVDQWQRPVAYHLHPHHPGDYHFAKQSGNKLIRVPAEDIIHLYIHERIGQTRGVPWLSASLLRAKHLAGFEEAELVKARGQASFMGFVQSPDPDTLASDVDARGQSVADFAPGEIFHLQPGQQFQGFAPTSPGQQFDPFVKMMLRGISTGLGIAYETLSNDFSSTTFSSARQSILAEREAFKRLQGWYIRSFRRPLYKVWLEVAVLSGALKLPYYELRKNDYQKAKFIPRRWDWVDPTKDVNAKVAAINAGITSLTQVIAETGRDFEEVMSEREQELDLLSSLTLESLIQTPSEIKQKTWRAK